MIIKNIDLYEQTGMKRPGGEAGRLRIYIHDGPNLTGVAGRRRPAALIIPGGGYSHCSAREGEPVALRFLSRGWNAAVLDYSCGPHPFPVPLREAAAGMAWFRRNAGELGVDPEKIAALGFSAGGHLCGMLGTMWDAPELEGISPPELIRPDALGLCYAVGVSRGRTHEGTFENISGGDRALRDRLSIDRLIRPDMMPVFLWHTRDDECVPCRNTLLMAAALEEAGMPFEVHVYAHGRHGLSTADDLVYPSFALPEVSGGVRGWCGDMIRFFEENGFKIRDEEEKK